jgi:hypothetical protein
MRRNERAHPGSAKEKATVNSVICDCGKRDFQLVSVVAFR